MKEFEMQEEMQAETAVGECAVRSLEKDKKSGMSVAERKKYLFLLL